MLPQLLQLPQEVSGVVVSGKVRSQDPAMMRHHICRVAISAPSHSACRKSTVSARSCQCLQRHPQMSDSGRHGRFRGLLHSRGGFPAGDMYHCFRSAIVTPSPRQTVCRNTKCMYGSRQRLSFALLCRGCAAKLVGRCPPLCVSLSLSLSLLNDTSPMMHLNVMMHLRMLQCRMALAQDWTKA